LMDAISDSSSLVQWVGHSCPTSAAGRFSSHFVTKTKPPGLCEAGRLKFVGFQVDELQHPEFSVAVVVVPIMSRISIIVRYYTSAESGVKCENGAGKNPHSSPLPALPGEGASGARPGEARR
jgi:hypothetical protein